MAAPVSPAASAYGTTSRRGRHPGSVTRCTVHDAEPDTIRLSVPADEDMRPVVEVAIGVLARRAGLHDHAVEAARAAGAAALADLCHDEDGPVTIELATARGGQLTLRVATAAGARTIRFP